MAATHRPLTAPLLKLLDRELGPGALTLDRDCLETAARDATTLSCLPEAVVRAKNSRQVQTLLRLASAHGFPVTPRGAGTGLAGGALAVQGGVVLDLSAMDRILELDPADMVAVVEPGVVTARLRQAAEELDLFYPPDPASLGESTLGGNAATNAGGPACVKYGTTRNYVLGCEAVLPSGELVTTGTRTRKGVVGYDLTQLLVGSEGTLAVITGLVLKLVPRPRAVLAQSAVFTSLDQAMQAVSAIMAGGVTPSAVEFLDGRCLQLIQDLLPVDAPPPGSSLLLLETDGASPGQTREDMERIIEVCRSQGALHILPAPDEASRQSMWEVRRQVSLRIHERWPVYVPEDVALPLGRIAAFVRQLPELEQELGCTIYAFGHAGDGNIHVNITAAQEHDPGKVEATVRGLLERVLALQGTISGEHGVGMAKKRFLDLEIGPASLALQSGLKQLFDPKNILNPGKIF